MAKPGPFNYPHFPYLEFPDLPRLPVQSLDITLNRYLNTVKQLVSEEEFMVTKETVEKFRNLEGPILHRMLEDLDKECPTSWLEGFWDSMYLETRDPSPINVNPFFVFEDDPSNSTQTGRAASLIFSALKFYQKIKSNKLERDFDRKTPLCMCQYGRLFASERIPKFNRDELRTFMDSKHIVVMCKSNFYAFQVLDSHDRALNEAEIERCLRVIAENAKLCSPCAPIGVLTTEERNYWASIRSELCEFDRSNEKSLEIIDRSLFVVCLDDSSPSGFEEISPVLLHSDGHNRWFDKCFQFIVFRNGKAGLNMEHSGIDGHTILRFCFETCVDSIKKQRNGDTNFDPSIELIHAFPERLSWNLSNSLRDAISTADMHFQRLVSMTGNAVLEFKHFGGKFITSHKMSPDALVQIAFQLAFYRIYGHVGSTYESAMTKQFYHGRTDCIRSVTPEVVSFCKLWTSDASEREKELSLRRAMEAHVKLSNECRNGRGIDRPLYGYQWLARQRVQKIANYKMPALFTDKAYATMKTDLLSTSNCSSAVLSLFGFGPTAAKGFGLGYMIRENAIHVNITSFIGQQKRFAQMLEQILLSFQRLMEKSSTETALQQTSKALPSKAKL